jgi:GMP synthase (glutamine-hydrolysing)
MFEAKSTVRSKAADLDNIATERPQRMAKGPVLIVLHHEQSEPGHVGHWFCRNGYALDVRKPRYGDPLPATLKHHCGAVIFGGPMSANDKDEFIYRETQWIGVALKEHKPLLGICLGAQMLANHLGAKVGFHPEDLAEIGYYRILTTPAAQTLGPFPDHVYQWHREGFGLAHGASLLATSTGAYPNQAFSYGSAIAVQFHPEITYAQVHRWTGHNPLRLGMKGARARHEHIEGHLHYAPKVRAWLDRFLRRWVAAELTIA